MKSYVFVHVACRTAGSNSKMTDLKGKYVRQVDNCAKRSILCDVVGTRCARMLPPSDVRKRLYIHTHKAIVLLGDKNNGPKRLPRSRVEVGTIMNVNVFDPRMGTQNRAIIVAVQDLALMGTKLCPLENARSMVYV